MPSRRSRKIQLQRKQAPMQETLLEEGKALSVPKWIDSQWLRIACLIGGQLRYRGRTLISMLLTLRVANLIHTLTRALLGVILFLLLLQDGYAMYPLTTPQLINPKEMCRSYRQRRHSLARAQARRISWSSTKPSGLAIVLKTRSSIQINCVSAELLSTTIHLIPTSR